MQEINIQETEQVGGWFNVQIFTLDELKYCPPVITNNNASSIVIEPSTEALDILPVANNIKITEPRVITKQGSYFNIKAEFNIYLQKKEIDTYFFNHLTKKVVLVGIKKDGQQKIYGSKNFPLNFSYTAVNGKTQEEGSWFVVTVFGKTPQKPVFIND